MRKLLIALTVVVIVAIGVVVAFKTIWGGDAPEEVSLSTSEPVASGDVSFPGTWTIDNTSGEFDRANEKYTRTYAGYRINEELANIGANTAVGRTDDVTGSMTIADTSITAVDVSVDMTSLESDQDRRDGALHQRGLQTDQYPIATFKLAEPIAIGKEPKAGQKITADATGDFALHGVTKRITVPIEARWTGSKIQVISSFDVQLADYNIEPPTIPGRVLSVEDHGKVELQLNFVKAN